MYRYFGIVGGEKDTLDKERGCILQACQKRDIMETLLLLPMSEIKPFQGRGADSGQRYMLCKNADLSLNHQFQYKRQHGHTCL